MSSYEACNATAKRLSEVGECISIPADLSTMAGIEHLVNEFKSREERLDILVNNAGSNWGAPIDDFPESGWDKVMNLNVSRVTTIPALPATLCRRKRYF